MRRLLPTTFVAQFALLSAALLAVAGMLLAQVLGGLIEDRARSDAAKTGAVITGLGIAPRLGTGDFAGPLDATARRNLRNALSLVGGGQNAESGLSRLLRVNIFRLDGTVIYSDEPSLVGERIESEELEEELAEVAEGSTVSSVTRLDGDGEHPGGGELALEVYVPLRYGLDEPLGVAEIYLPFAPVAAEIRHDKLVLYGALSATLLLFFLAMFRMVRRASTRLRTTAERSEYLARHDALTGLPNRALLLERLQQAIQDPRQGQRHVAVLLVDLDRFKEVNDTLGHETGDLLLQEVGRRIEEELRSVDSVARLGGDEFVVLLPGVDGLDGPHGATAAAARILDALHRPFEVRGVDLAVEASVGVACYPEHGDEQGVLLQHADVAMYAAKQSRGTFVVYDQDTDISSLSRITMLHELRRALEHDELVLYYQPKEELSDGSVRSVEALVRWEHPERGLVPPNDFLPLAEQTGLITALTRTVLAQAFRQLRTWHDEGRRISVSVNLSARNLLDPDLPDTLAQMAADAGVDPTWLEVEVTETSAMTDPVRASEILRRLAGQGVSVSVDDYGTGYSSLSYLRSLPIDTLKIDRSFVTAMLQDEGNAVIVRSTVELAHNLGLRVVAEGVEDVATRGALAMLGCHVAQGYYLSRPLPPGELEALLDGRTEADVVVPVPL